VTSSEATTAQWDVDAAENNVKVAQDNVTFWESLDPAYGADALKQAKADLARAKADLEKAKTTLQSEKSKSSAAEIDPRLGTRYREQPQYKGRCG